MLVFFEGEPGFRSGNQTSLEFGLMSLTSRYSCSLTGTVHMFLIFSMKRADILPIGDLGTFSPLWVSLPLALFQSHSLC